MAVIEHQGTVAHIVNNATARTVGHTSATGAIILSWVHVFGEIGSAVATFMAILWYAVTLYESKTVQDIITRWAAQKVLGPKVAAQRDAVNKLIVAVDTAQKADALPDETIKPQAPGPQS